jgi:hypothetical protein
MLLVPSGKTLETLAVTHGNIPNRPGQALHRKWSQTHVTIIQHVSNNFNSLKHTSWSFWFRPGHSSWWQSLFQEGGARQEVAEEGLLRPTGRFGTAMAATKMNFLRSVFCCRPFKLYA